MTLLLDAAPLVALADRRDPAAASVRDALLREPGPLVIPAPVTAEVDYLLGRRLGQSARWAFLDDLAQSRFVVGCLDPDDHAEAARLDRQYSALDLGLADCALIVLAARHDTRRLLTFDARHFRVVRPLQGGWFDLLPADPQ